MISDILFDEFMNKKYHLILNSIFSILIISLAVAAHHGGESSLTNITPSRAGIAPITWIIFGGILLLIAYGVYWIFSKDKKPF